MAYYKSSEAIKKNAESWTQNVAFGDATKRRDIPIIETLSSFTRLPRKKDIIGRHHTLLETVKDKKERMAMITGELTVLWEKFSFPILAKQTIMSKVVKLIEENDKNRKRKKDSFQVEIENIFDVTKTDGNWLCQEDKELYKVQVRSQGKIGYVTSTVAPQSSIHPSKRVRKSASQSEPNAVFATDVDVASSAEVSSDEIFSDTTSVSEESENDKRKRVVRFSTSHAAKLVTKKSLSSNKAAVVCSSLAEDGISVPTPSQSGVWRAVIRSGEDAKRKIKSILQEERQFCLHFDGKRIANHEYQVVILKSSLRELKLGVVKCESGSSQDIFNALQRLLNEFDAWKNFKMIVCDKTAVNTGRVNGIVQKLKTEMVTRGFDQPQYIGCQHHILDRIVKHVLDFFNPISSTKPTLNYEFVDEVIKQYDVLQQSYKPESEMITVQNPGWRDDFRFLYELCRAFRFLKETGAYPVIQWRKLPSLHNARWNSRAIYALISYFLIPKWRISLEIPCAFISNTWQDAWFSNQMFNAEIHQKLMDGISELNCSAAMKCFVTHWDVDRSVVDIPRTNICAERGVKLMEELYQKCKTDKYLNLKLISTNTL